LDLEREIEILETNLMEETVNTGFWSWKSHPKMCQWFSSSTKKEVKSEDIEELEARMRKELHLENDIFAPMAFDFPTKF